MASLCQKTAVKLTGYAKALIGRIFLFSNTANPVSTVFFGYLSYVLFGWAMLSLPISRAVDYIAPIDNFFIATSAMSTTGLTTISVSDNYTIFGQLVILFLIQLGGIGYMTFGSFVILSQKATLSSARAEISKTVFSLPKSFEISKFIKSVIIYTIVVEMSGMLLLWWAFAAAGAPYPLYNAFFHSISAFCTAGFSTFNDSFMSYSDNFWILSIISVLSYLGAIGFIVFVDYWRRYKNETAQVTLTSKIILWTTFWLSIVGTILIFLGEPMMQNLDPAQRLLSAFFQCMTAMTTVGFNSVDVGIMSKASVLILMVLMIIGASPSGTGGGVKSTTFSAILGIIRSAMRGERKVTYWGRVIPFERLWVAVASSSIYIVFLIVGVYLLFLTESASFDKIFFEAASAIGTVGLSMGITTSLTGMGKIIITLLMLGGRIGPLTVGMALFLKKTKVNEPEDNDLAV